MTTKEQERKVLAQIKKLVEGLGESSYIGTAFEGCFEIAAQNIENDWACSMKDNAETAERKLNALELRYKQDVEHLQGVKTHLEKKVDDLEKDCERLKARVIELNGFLDNERVTICSNEAKAEEQANEIAQQAQEIIELKAKLYDMITYK